MEIERKFQINYLPDHLEQFQKKEIEQGYLCVKPVVRIRKSNDNYILTYKANPKLSNIEDNCAKHSTEIEAELTKDAYNHLKGKIDNYLIEKTRYLIPLDEATTAELDIFKGRLEGLCFVEVEFDSEENAKKFIIPDWFGKDVTFNIKYKNSYLSTVEYFSNI